MTLYWPTSVLKPQSVSAPFLAPRTLAGSASLNGQTQVSATDAGVWVFELNNIPIFDRNKVLCWRAIEGLLEGRLNPINVPLYSYELDYAPYATDLDYASLLLPVPHSDDAYFSDTGGYIGGIADIKTTTSAALRAVSLTVSVTYAPTLQSGMIFSIDHPIKGSRWYKVRTYDSDTGIMTFRPPLREAVAADTFLEFDRPICRMRLTDDNAMMLPLQAPAYGFTSLSFVEDL